MAAWQLLALTATTPVLAAIRVIMSNLEGWQMSASYPQDAVQSQFRNILKTMARNTEKGNKTETTVSIEVENGCLTWLKDI